MRKRSSFIFAKYFIFTKNIIEKLLLKVILLKVILSCSRFLEFKLTQMKMEFSKLEFEANNHGLIENTISYDLHEKKLSENRD